MQAINLFSVQSLTTDRLGCRAVLRSDGWLRKWAPSLPQCQVSRASGTSCSPAMVACHATGTTTQQHHHLLLGHKRSLHIDLETDIVLPLWCSVVLIGEPASSISALPSLPPRPHLALKCLAWQAVRCTLVVQARSPFETQVHFCLKQTYRGCLLASHKCLFAAVL